MMNRNTCNPLAADSHWWHRLHLSSQKFAIVLTMTAFVTGLVYVLMTNTTAANGFAMDTLQRQLSELKMNNEKLQLEAADLRSLSTADRAGQALGLKPTTSFEVLPTAAGSVARTP